MKNNKTYNGRGGRRRRRIEAALICALEAAGIAFLLAAALVAAVVWDAPCLGEETAHEAAWHEGRGR